MTAGIIGLGLIGGSFAKAYHEAGERVLAYNRSKEVTDFAMINGDVDGELTDDNISECDIIIICTYPEAAADFLRRIAPYVRKDTVVMDACGTKRRVCELCFPIAEEYGFTFVGGHPMAGTKNSGFKYAFSTLFKDQPIVLVLKEPGDIYMLDKIKKLLSPVGFGTISVTTADAHDKMIAFTSQMPHIISNAFIKSPEATGHKGFSAGSYKDLTRVAWLNSGMWTELFMENKDNILEELAVLISNLQKYETAIKEDNAKELTRLLDEGRIRKEEVDGNQQ